MLKCKTVVLFLFLTGWLNTLTAQQFKRAYVEQSNKLTIAKAYSASVRMWGFDTIKKAQNSGQFSGVVVSGDGYILTVAHAIVPGQTYRVFFPDGKDAIAVALGRIGFKNTDNMPDMGMMKIVTSGKWPFAEMGWSSSLKVDAPCISISYPETLSQKLPTVRFGRVVDVLNQWGFIQSTCIMEPGDSGGPLFDEQGRVVGLHSRCDVMEDVNLEVPIDLYRKYWSALKETKDYDSLPQALTAVPMDPKPNRVKAVPGLANLQVMLKADASKYSPYAIRVSSSLKGRNQRILGSALLVKATTAKGGNKSGVIIVSKSSMVGANPIINLEDGRQLKASIMFRNKETDLVVMQIRAESIPAVDLYKSTHSDTLVFGDLGKFLLSPLDSGKFKSGVLGSGYIKQPRKFSSGYFGASANFMKERIILTRMADGSPAAEAKLQLGDDITGINGIPISRPEHYGAELVKYSAGDTIGIQLVRSGIELDMPVILKNRPKMPVEHAAERFPGGKSAILDGFERVFTQDATIKPEECGGPVFDASGKFYGINIARFSRTTTLVMPADVIKKMLEPFMRATVNPI